MFTDLVEGFFKTERHSELTGAARNAKGPQCHGAILVIRQLHSY